ncbi:MAG TPA: hypothetical protein VM598_00795 [Bdellovibrionota bacterium]|nr:hypothetical protein [Bdellovibrionota bacterium]
MRRMRGFLNGWVITLAVTAAVGYFAVRHWPSHSVDTAKTSVTADRDLASSDSKKKIKDTTKKKIPVVESHDDEMRKLEEHELTARDVEREEDLNLRPNAARIVSRGVCQSVEYRGSGPQAGRITTEQWKKVMTQFHGAKRDLLGWLEAHRADFPKEVAAHMEDDVRELRLQRPPTPDFPDMAFRGIGLWTRPAGERPIIKLGGGFAKLVEKHPTRAKFELSRLIAQTWAPCELKRSPVAKQLPSDGPWAKLMSCLSVQEDQSSCAPGGFSEAGWAVSSAVAAVASAPGCTVPAFSTGVGAGCLKEMRAVSVRAPASKGYDVITTPVQKPVQMKEAH